jgi:hypothetical protein
MAENKLINKLMLICHAQVYFVHDSQSKISTVHKKITSQKYQKPRPLKVRAYLYCMLVKSIVPCVGYSNDINFTPLLLVTARFPCDIISIPIKKSKPSPLLSKSPARTFIKVTLFCNVRLTLYLGATILPFAV